MILKRIYYVIFLVLLSSAVYVSRQRPIESRFGEKAVEPTPVAEIIQSVSRGIESISPRYTVSDLSFSPSPARQIISLTGEWEFQPSELSLPEPVDEKWEKSRVVVPIPWNANGFNEQFGGDFVCQPSYPKAWNSLRAGWMRKSFQGPGSTPGDRWFLRFEGAAHKSIVYLNKKKIGENDDGFMPFEFEITDLIISGEENEIMIGCAGWEYYADNNRRNLPSGSFWGFHMVGLWQGASLVRRPEIFVRNTAVETDISKGKLSVHISLDTGRTVEKKVQISHHILPWKPDRSVDQSQSMIFSEKEVEIENSSLLPISTIRDWSMEQLWSPENPNLFLLRTRILNTEGEAIDEITTRFGFREIEIRGNLLYLNGEPIRLRGDAWHYMGSLQQSRAYARTWYKLARETGLNCIRLHAQPYPSFYLDLADEMGLLIIDESALWASGILMWYDEAFWERYQSHLRSLVTRDRNHPSVILWSVANEIFAAHDVDPHDGAGNKEQLAEKLMEAVETVRLIDPTRQAYSDGDQNLLGGVPIFSFHYPHILTDPEIPLPVLIGEAGPMHYARPDAIAPVVGESVYADRESWLIGIGDYVDNYFANYRRWAALTTPFNIVWYSMEPIGEFSGTVSASGINEASPERIPPYSITLDPITESWQGNRLYKTIKDLMKPLTVFTGRDVARVHSESTSTILVTVHNDLYHELEVELEWTAAMDGTVFASGTFQDAFHSSQWRDIDISIQTPSVESIKTGVMKLNLNSGLPTSVSKEMLLEIYPRRTRVTVPRRAGSQVHYIGTEDIPHWLPDAKMTHELPDDSIALGDTLVIGKDRSLTTDEVFWLERQVHEGLKIIALGPKKTLLDGFHLNYNPRIEPAQYGHIMDVSHPIFAGLSDSAFSVWSPTNSVAGWSLPGEAGRTAYPLLTVRAGESALVEIPVGKGCIILCCLSLENAIPGDPAAIVFLQNMLNYLADYKTRVPRQAYILEQQSALSYFDLDLPVLDFNSHETKDQAGILIMNAGVLSSTNESIASVKDLVADGWTAIIVNTTPETLEHCREVVGCDFRLKKTDAASLVKNGHHKLLAGMHNDDLYWLEQALTRTIMKYGIVIDSTNGDAEVLLKTPALDWRKWNWRPEMVKTSSLYLSAKEGGEGLAGLVRIPFVEGEFLLLQIQREQDYLKWRKTSGILLSNLGLSFQKF